MLGHPTYPRAVGQVLCCQGGSLCNPKGPFREKGRVPLEQLLPALPERKSPGDPYMLWKLFSKAQSPHREGSPQQTRADNPHDSQKTWWSACRCQLPGIPDTWNLPTGVRECE